MPEDKKKEEAGRRVAPTRRAEESRGKGSASLYAERPGKVLLVEEAEKPRIPFFVKLTKSVGRAFRGFGKGSKFSEAQADAFAFLGWEVTAEEFYATYKTLFVFGLLLGAVAGGLLYVFLPVDDVVKLGVLGVCLLAPLFSSFYYLKYPYSAVEKQKIQSLAYVPEIVNYLAMSLRLSPNLERAVAFAAEHGRGKIAEDLKKIVWDVQIGRFLSVEEALDDLAYRWGGYNEDFKHALMLIRASVLEPSKAEREEMLEKASADVLEGTREKMDLYARKLHQPTVYLYYFGILLPLLLAIILPIGGGLSGQSLAKPEYLFLAYNILIPVGVYLFGQNILAGRPPTYAPPEIPKNFPGVRKRGSLKIVGVIALLLVAWLGYATDQGETQAWVNSIILPVNGFLNSLSGGAFNIPGVDPNEGVKIVGTLGGIPVYLSPEARAEEIAKLPHLKFFYDEWKIFVGNFTTFGFLIGFSLFLYFWLTAEYADRKRVQDEIRLMEGEFKDALYVLASRLGENKPIEEALRSAVQFLPKSAIAKTVFRRVLDNITTMGMSLDAAIFDETFGALRMLPSRVIRSGMQFLVYSVELGVNVAAKSLISLSLQLRNAAKIDESLKKLLEDVTTVLRTMSTFVAPIVLAVVSAMQKLITSSIAQAGAGAAEATPTQLQAGGVAGFNLPVMFGSEAVKQAADPATFTLIMGVYVIQIVALLTYFTAQVEDPRNKLHVWTSIGKALPLAAFLYSVVVYFAGTSIGGFT